MVSVSEGSFKLRQTDSLTVAARLRIGLQRVAGVGALTCSNGVHAVALAKASCGRGSDGGLHSLPSSMTADVEKPTPLR
jgi:hypothetical protein